MTGVQDMFPVRSSDILHSSQPAGRKSAKGYSASKLRGCSTSSSSSSFRKGGESKSARSGMTEAMILATTGERQELFGGKISREQPDNFIFPGVAQSSTVLDKQDVDFLVRSNIPDEGDCRERPDNPDKEIVLWSLSGVADPSMQHSPTEKVAKWLGEFESSTLTELPGLDALAHISGEEVSRFGQHVEENSNPSKILATCVVATAKGVSDNKGKELGATFPNGSSLIEAPVKVRSVKKSLLVKPFLHCVKIILCLSIVLLGNYMWIRPTSLEDPEPPPT